LRWFGRNVQVAALAAIAFLGCGSNFAVSDWEDLDSPIAAEVTSALPAIIEINDSPLFQIKQIPRQIDGGAAPLRSPVVVRVVFASAGGFYYLHEHIRERAPPSMKGQI
jgi:hypothetical protein